MASEGVSLGPITRTRESLRLIPGTMMNKMAILSLLVVSIQKVQIPNPRKKTRRKVIPRIHSPKRVAIVEPRKEVESEGVQDREARGRKRMLVE